MRCDIINNSIVLLRKMNYAKQSFDGVPNEGGSRGQRARYGRSLAELNETYYVEMGNGAVLRSIRMWGAVHNSWCACGATERHILFRNEHIGQKSGKRCNQALGVRSLR